VTVIIPDGAVHLALVALSAYHSFLHLLHKPTTILGVVQGKCPGLPPPPVGNNFGGGDPYTFYVEVGSIVLVGTILLIVMEKIGP